MTKICAGAALMGEPDNLVSMVSDIVESIDVPVTAKMRLGTGASAHNAVEICQRLEKVGAQRLCVHGRTLRQRYSGVADWDYIKQVVESVEVPVIANGDVIDWIGPCMNRYNVRERNHTLLHRAYWIWISHSNCRNAATNH